MEPTDLTIEILKSIRDEVKGLRVDVQQTNSRLDQTNARLESGLTDLRDELSRRIVESELRTSTAITDLAGTVREMTSFLRNTNDLRPRLERCESDIADLKSRLPDA
jgi:predicted  nucleic acid-binding Zn-ribbon protein